MATFSDRANAIVATAARIARLQSASVEATLLEKARARLLETGYDNLDGGVTYFTLMLEVPVPTYAAIEERRGELEKSVHERIKPLVRTEFGNRIAEVIIGPSLDETSRPPEPQPEHPEEALPEFWQEGFFRAFVTHLAEHRLSAHRLKEGLARFHVAAFVAHDDIEPTKEWQTEIERALRTMDALVAIVTPGFVDSRWCDQEVGFALGRRRLVVPLLKGADPHGFIAKHQGIRTEGQTPNAIAERLVDTFIQNPSSSPRMTETLVELLVASSSWSSSKQTMALLERTQRLTSSQIARLVSAIDENVEVGQAAGVPDRLRNLIQRVGETV